MARTDTLGHFLTDVAGAIKTKKGDQTAIQASSFDTEITNLPSGGGEIVNGLVEQYAASDETVSENNFIELVKEWASTDTQISQNAYITNNAQGYDIVKLTDTTAFIAYTYENATNSLGGMVVTLNSDCTITKGTAVQLNSTSNSGKSINIVKLSSTKVVVLHNSSRSETLGAVVVSISGTTISASSPVTLDGNTNSSNAVRGTCIYANESDGEYWVMIINRNNAYLPVYVYYVSSSNSITLVANNNITTLGYGAWGNARLVKTSNNSAMLVCGYDNNQNVLTGVMCVYDGDTTITFGSPTTLTLTNEKKGYMDAQQLDTNKVIIANSYGGKLHTLICTINDTTITPGTYDTIDSATNEVQDSVSCSVFSSTLFFVSYYNPSSQLVCSRFIVIGDYVVKSSTSKLLQVSNNYGAKIAALTDYTACLIHEISGLGYIMGVDTSSHFMKIKKSESSIDGVTKEEITTSTPGDVTILNTLTKNLKLSKRQATLWFGWDLELTLTAEANVPMNRWDVYIDTIEIMRGEEDAYDSVEETDTLVISDSSSNTLYSSSITINMPEGITSQFIAFQPSQRPTFDIPNTSLSYVDSWTGDIQDGGWVWDCRTKSTEILLPAQGVDSSEIEIVNGIEGQYRASTGTIPANAFVSFKSLSYSTDKTIVSTNNSGSCVSKGVLIDTNKVFIVYTNGGTAGSGVRCAIATISGQSITLGTAAILPLFSSTSQPANYSVLKLATDKVLVVYNSYSNTTPATAVNAVICTISGTTITVGTAVNIVNQANSGKCLSAIMLDANRVFIAYSGDWATDSSRGTLSGVVCTISNNTITTGTTLTLSSITNSIAESSYLTPVKVDTNKVLVLYGDTSNYLTGCLCSIDNISITILESDITISNYGQSSENISAAVIEPNKVLVASKYNSSYLSYRIVYTNNNTIVKRSETYTQSYGASPGNTAVLTKPNYVAYIKSGTAQPTLIYSTFKINGDSITHTTYSTINSTNASGFGANSVNLGGQKLLLLHSIPGTYKKVGGYIIDAEQTCMPPTTAIQGLTTQEISTTHYGSVWTL